MLHASPKGARCLCAHLTAQHRSMEHRTKSCRGRQASGHKVALQAHLTRLPDIPVPREAALLPRALSAA